MKKPQINFRFSPSTRTKIAWGVLGLAFGLMTVLLSLDLVVSKEREQKISRQSAANILALAKGSITPIFEKTDIVLQRVVTDYQSIMRGLEVHDQSIINQELATLMANLPEAQQDSLRLINSEGRVVFNAGTRDRVPDMTVSDKNYFNTQKTNANAGMVISEPILSRLTGRWLITLSRRFNHADGSFAGIAQISIKSDYIQQLFDKVAVGNKSGISLFALDGGLILRSPDLPDNVDFEYKLNDVFELLNSGVNQGNVVTKSYIDGKTNDVSFLKIQNAPMIITIGMSPDDYLSDWHRKAAYYTICLIFMAFMMGGLGYIARQSKIDSRTKKRAVQSMEKAVAGEAFKTQLLAVFGRELKAPVTSIINDLNRINEDGVSDDQRVIIEDSKAKSNEMLRVMQNINRLIEIESGSVVANRTVVDLNDLLAAPVEAIRAEAQDKELAIETDCSGLSTSSIETDPELLSGAVSMLLRNAVRFSHAGKICLNTKLTKNENSDMTLRVEVVDEGVGMPQYQVDTLFSALDHSQKSMELSPDGISLSLSIIGKTIVLLGGVIGAESKEGKGSTFWFEIPVGVDTESK